MTNDSTRPDKQRPEGLKTIRIEYYHSAEGYPEEQQAKVRSLGLTKVGQVVTRPDTRTMHHIISDLPHLLRIIE
jgi:large subunit ribosomal protein L30